MKTRDELLIKAKALKITKANGGLNATQLANLPDAELIAYIAKNSPETTESEKSETTVVAIEGMNTFTTEKGEIIPIVNATFSRNTSNGFAFTTETGVEIIANDLRLTALQDKGLLAIGEIFAFVPESITFNPKYNSNVGKLNVNASPLLKRALDFQLANAKYNKSRIANLVLGGFTNEEAKNTVMQEFAEESRKNAAPRPTL